jgi:hypothetical protein
MASYDTKHGLRNRWEADYRALGRSRIGRAGLRALFVFPYRPAKTHEDCPQTEHMEAADSATERPTDSGDPMGSPEGENPPKKANCNVRYALGKEFMLFRIRDGEGQPWRACHGTEKGHVADSICHRYERLIGFVRPNQAEIESDPLVQQAYRDMREEEQCSGSAHQDRVNRWSIFERYLRVRHPQSPYCLWLQSLLSTLESHGSQHFHPQHGKFLAPPEGLTLTYVKNLRKDQLEPLKCGAVPDHKYEGIKSACGAIVGTMEEMRCAEKSPTHCSDVRSPRTLAARARHPRSPHCLACRRRPPCCAPARNRSKS